MASTDQNRSIPGTPEEWLARAKSNLALAQQPKPEEAFWEDLCYNAQQAAEKALKAVLQHNGIIFRYVHDLDELITALENSQVSVPDAIKGAVDLTQYAVETRYPGFYETITEEEYQQAIELATRVVDWAEETITPKSQESG